MLWLWESKSIWMIWKTLSTQRVIDCTNYLVFHAVCSFSVTGTTFHVVYFYIEKCIYLYCWKIIYVMILIAESSNIKCLYSVSIFVSVCFSLFPVEHLKQVVQEGSGWGGCSTPCWPGQKHSSTLPFQIILLMINERVNKYYCNSFRSSAPGCTVLLL